MLSFAIATLLSAACAVNAVNHTVLVAQNGALTFTPKTFDASVGDNVLFLFESGGHSATQANGTSCVPLKQGGFDSGVRQKNDVFTYTVTANGTLNYICKVGNHCSLGMDGSVNVANAAASSSTPASSSSSTTGAGAPNSTGAPKSTGGNGASNSSSDATQFGGGSVLGAAMALLVGLAL